MEYMGISVRMTTRDCYHSSRFVCSDEFSLLILTRHFKVLVLDHLNPALRNQSQAFRTQLLAIIFILFLLLPLLSGSHQRQIFNLGFGFFFVIVCVRTFSLLPWYDWSSWHISLQVLSICSCGLCLKIRSPNITIKK